MPPTRSLLRRTRFTAAALLVAATAVGGVLVAPAVANADTPLGTLDQSYDTSMYSVYSCAPSGQTFTAGRNGLLRSVSMKAASSSGDTSIAISAVSNGLPSGPTLASSTMSAGTGWVTATFASPPRLVAGTQYAISFSGGGPFFYNWNYDYNSAEYSGGYAGGSLFHCGYDYAAEDDFAFRTYMSTVDAPGNVAATAGDGTAALSWTAPPAPADPEVTLTGGYTVQTAPSGSGSWTTAATVTGTSTTLTGLTNGSAYDVRVAAGSSDGDGDWSTPVHVTPIGDFVQGGVGASGSRVAVGVEQTAGLTGWSPAPNQAWTWTANGTTVGTGATYTPTPADEGKTLSVTLTASKYGYHTVTKTAQLGLVQKGTIVPGAVTLRDASGSAVGTSAPVGTTITASLPSVSPAGSTTTYQWYRNDTAHPIAGATSADYTVTPAEYLAENDLLVVATAQTPGYTTATSTSSSVAATIGTQSGSVSTGAAIVDSDVVAAVTGQTPADADLSFQWFDGETTILGATSDTYRPTPMQLGDDLHVTVTAKAPGYTTRVFASAPQTVGAGTQHGTVGIDGTPVVGSVLTATPDGWLDRTALAYAWTRDGQPIDGATGATYTPTADDLGSTIGVTATGVLQGYTTETNDATTTSDVIAGTQHGVVTIPATATSGSALTASTTDWVDGTTFAYRWLRDGTAIDGATDRSYTPADADLGHALSVEVTGTLAGWNGLTTTSDASEPVVGTSPTVVTPGLPVTIAAGQPYSYRVAASGSPAPTLTLHGTLPKGIEFDPETGLIAGTSTVAGHYVVSVEASNGVGVPVVQTIAIDIAAGPTTSLELTTTGTGTETDGGVTADQGSTISVHALGLDEWANATGDVDGVVLTSSVASDEIHGDRVTFHHASPHVITATANGMTASVLVHVIPTAATTEPGTDPTTAAPTAAAKPATTTTHRAAADDLAYTGSESAPVLAIGLLALLAGVVARTVTRRRRMRG